MKYEESRRVGEVVVTFSLEWDGKSCAESDLAAQLIEKAMIPRDIDAPMEVIT